MPAPVRDGKIRGRRDPRRQANHLIWDSLTRDPDGTGASVTLVSITVSPSPGVLYLT